ncbi:MAG: CTP synthase (glutamine hydrolyzing) [Promethearchaeota archaeon]
MNPKYVFVTGGVMSGIGKGITTASIGKLFQFRGFKVSVIKIDPYLNVDPGTLNPVEHGECFVTEDVWEFRPVDTRNGEVFRISEIDQDFGAYERFLGITISPSHNITSGQIYLETILKERKGEFLGKTVQIIPHCTDIIKQRIRRVAEEEDLDVLLVECGGTVGDVESVIYLEAFRQMRLELPKTDTALVHVTLVPFSRAVGQLKSKPTQHSVKALQAMGLQPDVLVCRAEVDLAVDPGIQRKISLFSNVPVEAVISNPDLEFLYELPLVFERQHLGDHLCTHLDMKPRLVEFSKVTNFSEWEKMVRLFKEAKDTVTIAMPGKYVDIVDSYISINEALKHAGAHAGTRVKIEWIDTTNTRALGEVLERVDGILLTPGFGARAVDGMIWCAEYAMERKKPYLGICFGAQLFFIAYCRRVLGLEGAHTTEIDPGAPYPVVDLMDEQRGVEEKGGTMRLGGHPVIIEEGTRLHEAYGCTRVVERFRHRFHIRESFLRGRGGDPPLVVSARDESGKIVNAIELADPDHFMVGTQFHPEFKSRPYDPSPIYQAFLRAVLDEKLKR